MLSPSLLRLQKHLKYMYSFLIIDMVYMSGASWLKNKIKIEKSDGRRQQSDQANNTYTSYYVQIHLYT